jgi:translation elongation factor P/translation initiation factor 5A
MKKKAKDLKGGEKISLAGRSCTVKNIEISDIGKQGKRKCRIEATAENGDKVIIIRPEDYPIDTE